LRKVEPSERASYAAEFLDGPADLALIRKLAAFPDAVVRSRETYTPSTLATYLHKLAVTANKFYETTPVLKDENANRRNARLALIETAANVLSSGLSLLGMKTLEKI